MGQEIERLNNLLICKKINIYFNLKNLETKKKKCFKIKDKQNKQLIIIKNLNINAKNMKNI